MLIKTNKNNIKAIFYFLSAVLLLFMVAELVWPNSVLSYLNINYVFAVWVACWLLLI